MTKKENLADKYGLYINSTDNIDDIKSCLANELDFANNLELKCDNFTTNEESAILDDYDAYICKKKQEKEQKRKNLLVKILDYLRGRNKC